MKTKKIMFLPAISIDDQKKTKKSIFKNIIIDDKIESGKFVDEDFFLVLNEKETSAHYLTNGNFQICDFIEKIIDLLQGIESLYISTLSYSEENIKRILTYYDAGKIKDIKIMRCSFFENDKKEKYSNVKTMLDLRGIKEKKYACHTKVYLIKKNENYLIISGSQNLTFMPGVFEQFSLFNSNQLYDFYLSWFNQIFEEP